MKNKNERQFKEVTERYCYVIDENAPMSRVSQNNEVHYECLNKHKCSENGGCKNRKFCGM